MSGVFGSHVCLCTVGLATMWVLGIKPRSSGRLAGVPLTTEMRGSLQVSRQGSKPLEEGKLGAIRFGQPGSDFRKYNLVGCSLSAYLKHRTIWGKVSGQQLVQSVQL